MSFLTIGQFKIMGGVLVAAFLLSISCSDPNPTSLIFSNGQATAVKFEQADKLVLLQAQVENSRPLWFVLDSGSSRMLIDKKVADSLGLKAEGSSSVGGAGAGRVPISLIHDLSIRIGRLKSDHYEFASTDLSGLAPIIGRPIDGILGYEFLSRFVVTVDYARRQVVIRAPQSAFVPPGTPIPIEIVRKWPFVKARLAVEGVPPVVDSFLIDSGSGDAVDHPAVKQSKGEVRQTTTGNGLGQPVSGYVGTAESLEIGPLRLEHLPLACCGGTEETSKLIGSDVLSRYTVTFDYPHSRIFLAPRSDPSATKP